MIESSTRRVKRFRSGRDGFTGGGPAAIAVASTGKRSLGTGSPQRGQGVRGARGDAESGGSSALQKGQAAGADLMACQEVGNFGNVTADATSAASGCL